MDEEIKKKVTKKTINKRIDVTKYRIYTVTQQIYVGEYYYEGQINLYSKDEDIQFQIYCNNSFRKVKGHLAVPKGTHIKKNYETILEYNKFIKLNKKILKI